MADQNRRMILQSGKWAGAVFWALLWNCVAHALTIPPGAPGGAAAQKTVRVRLTEGVPRAEVRGFDLSILAGPARTGVTFKNKLSQWEFTCFHGKVRALSSGRAVDLTEPVVIRTPAGFLSYGGRPYRDELRIYSAGTRCEVINEVNLEKYLDGLVNAEFSARWNEEAIEAQVIAARTYAYYQMLQARSKASQHYDVDATVKDQVYDGSIREDFRASRAVENTRGVVLMPGASAAPVPIKAFYHSTCGGRTELPQNVWGVAFPGFKRTVQCLFCNRSPVYSWDVKMDAREISQILLKGAERTGGLPGWPGTWARTLRKGQLLDLRVSHLSPQARVLQVKTLWADGPQAVELAISGARFREWIGASRLKSAVFSISAEIAGRKFAGVPGLGTGRQWRFQGRGNGHGVGMCQWGAKIMGDRGYTSKAILSHYYPDAVLRRLW